MYQIRIVSLFGFMEQAAALGLDGRSLFERAGVQPEALKDPENRVPAEAVVSVIELATRESGCENFGLLMADWRTYATLGPVAMLLERLPNLREMVRNCIAYQRHFNDIMDLKLEETDGGYLVCLGLLPGPWPVQFGDLHLAMGHKVLRGASRGIWRPEVVHASRTPPADLAPWRRMFGASIEFDAEFNGFTVSREVMEAPNPQADATMAANARRLLGLIRLDTPSGELADRVRRTISSLIGRRRANLAEVAGQMGMSPRSLQRRLVEQGLRFDALLDEVRRNLAVSYLADTGQQVTRIAELLGYSSPSSFSRWFAGTFGMSATAWREAQRGK